MKLSAYVRTRSAELTLRNEQLRGHLKNIASNLWSLCEGPESPSLTLSSYREKTKTRPRQKLLLSSRPALSRRLLARARRA